MIDNARRILVLGGTGFIGRHVVAALRQSTSSGTGLAAEIVIGTRRSQLPAQQLPIRTLCFEALIDPSSWAELIDDFDTVINCVGILRPVGDASYDKVHHLAPAALAQACCGNGIAGQRGPAKRFVHVSALGLRQTAHSGFLTSKLAGEKAIVKAMQSAREPADWMIVRPSLLDGEGGYGAAWLRGVSRLPVFVAPRDAAGLIAALSATDVGEAIANLATHGCAAPSSRGKASTQLREFELGGTWHTNFEGYVRGLRSARSESGALCIKIPGIAARMGAHLCDLLHFTPFSFGHYELLRHDNLPNPNRLEEVLGRTPVHVLDQYQANA